MTLWRTNSCSAPSRCLPRIQWATFCDKDKYSLPEDCKAYTISNVSNTTVTLGDALTTVPAYTPVLIYRETVGTDAVVALFSAEGTVPASGYDSETGLASTQRLQI